MAEILEYVSYATARNWKRLDAQTDGRLTKRANKMASKKRILPLEYFLNRKNAEFIWRLLDMIAENGWSTESALFSIGVNLLKAHGILDQAHTQSVLSDYRRIETLEPLLNISLPMDEFDILGLIYQGLLLEGEKNRGGLYYTPFPISSNMTKGVSFSDGRVLLDPCCGSGSYLLACDAPDPARLFGIDNDSLAVMMAKINLLMKYKEFSFTPNVFCADYLRESPLRQKFDYIITNPPWGAVSERNALSGETFSLFFERAFRQLRKNGVMRFLFPEAALNVKAHRDIRAFMLSHGSIDSITIYDDRFTGVMTKYADISLSNRQKGSSFDIISKSGSKRVNISDVYETENLAFQFLNAHDSDILEKVKRLGAHTLQDSVWALGIVTGNNQEKLFDVPAKDTQPIYTGKEIRPYVLNPPKKHIVYNRAQLQQAAKDEIYRAPEKLVYKFISKKLVFAYDDTGALFLNSANILIPRVDGMSMKTVLAFLNSSLYQYLHIRLFGEIKILKGNLTQLPFPHIDRKTDDLISGLVSEYIASGHAPLIQDIETSVHNIFSLSEKDSAYIRSVIHGKTD